jgi:formylglycine-generating enzyme
MKKQRKPQVQNDHSKPAMRKTRRLALIGVLVVAAIAAGIGAASSYRSTRPPPPGPAPAGMKWIPGGEFIMGTDDANSMPNERPAHRVRLDGYWIDETPVTNAQFRKFVEATGYLTTAERPVDWKELKKQVPPGTPKPPNEKLQPGSLVYTPPDHPVDLRDMSQWWTWTTGANWRHPEGPSSTIDPKDNDPVVQVSWDDAVAYAKWAGKRLPTEAEWEYAARGGAKTNTRYWWGDEFCPGGKFMCNTFTGEFPFKNTAEDGFAVVAPVKSFPANGYGLYDMAGNVWNWCSDIYAADMHARIQDSDMCFNPTGPTTSFNPTRAVPASVERVTKGGSFLCNPNYCESYRPTARRGTPPDTGSGHVGFRCAMTPQGQSESVEGQ